ncbi:MAG: polysaccharide deacetylase family protein [Acetobacteraceae bacterium]
MTRRRLPPGAAWPGRARLALSLVVNVEEGAEYSLLRGDPWNERVDDTLERLDVPDPCMESHFAYGAHAGFRRVMDVLSAYRVRATFSACGRAAATSPWLVAEPAAAGHEVSAHGWRWEKHAGMAEAEEREAIARTVAAIEAACGRRPVGWHTRSSASENTRRLLAEHGGFLYDSDAYDDDVPYLIEVAGAPHVVLPYAFDTNDMRFRAGWGFVFAEDFARYCIAAFDRLWAEGATAPKMLSIGLHLRAIGRPARIGGLERFLDHVRSREEVWIARRVDIARHWRAVTGCAPLPDLWG